MALIIPGAQMQQLVANVATKSIVLLDIASGLQSSNLHCNFSFICAKSVES